MSIALPSYVVCFVFTLLIPYITGWPSLVDPAIVLGSTFLAGCAFLLYGVWLLATPSPGSIAAEAWHTPRRILRVCSLIAAGGLGTSLVFFALAPKNTLWMVTVLTISPFGFVSVIGAWTLCRYVRQLASRLPDDFTCGKANSYLRAYILSWAAFVGLGPLGSLALGVPSLLLSLFPGSIGVLAFGVLCLFLPSYLENHLAKAVRKAHELWAEAEGEVGRNHRN
jgi:hypothetical protein